MKKALIYFFTMFLVFTFTSCGKDGDLGPEGKQGIEGSKGDKGDPGTANVISSGWIDFDWSGFLPSYWWSASSRINKDAASVMQDGGVLLMYGRGTSNNGAFIQYSIPFIGVSSELVQEIVYRLYHDEDGADLEITVHTRGQAADAFVHQYRYVVIPKGVPMSKAIPNPTAADWKKLSFDQTQKILNLKN